MSTSTRLDETTVAHGTWTRFRTAWIHNLRVDTVYAASTPLFSSMCVPIALGCIACGIQSQAMNEESLLLCQSQCNKTNKTKSLPQHTEPKLYNVALTLIIRSQNGQNFPMCTTALSLSKEKSRDAEVKAQPWGQTPVASYCLAFPWFSIKQARRWLLLFSFFFFFCFLFFPNRIFTLYNSYNKHSLNKSLLNTATPSPLGMIE